MFEPFDAALLFSANAQPYPWRSAYSRDLLERESLRFAENVRFAEDVVFQFESYPLSAKTVVAPDKLYHYVMQDKSLTHTFNVGAKRRDKAEAHILMLHEILERWSARGLLELCPGELVAWFMDLVAFDLARFDAEDYDAVAASINAEFNQYFGANWASLPAKMAIRRVASKVARGSSVSLIDVVRLYLSTRGLKACIERFV